MFLQFWKSEVQKGSRTAVSKVLRELSSFWTHEKRVSLCFPGSKDFLCLLVYGPFFHITPTFASFTLPSLTLLPPFVPCNNLYDDIGPNQIPDILQYSLHLKILNLTPSVKSLL